MSAAWEIAPAKKMNMDVMVNIFFINWSRLIVLKKISDRAGFLGRKASADLHVVDYNAPLSFAEGIDGPSVMACLASLCP